MKNYSGIIFTGGFFIFFYFQVLCFAIVHVAAD